MECSPLKDPGTRSIMDSVSGMLTQGIRDTNLNNCNQFRLKLRFTSLSFLAAIDTKRIDDDNSICVRKRHNPICPFGWMITDTGPLSMGLYGLLPHGTYIIEDNSKQLSTRRRENFCCILNQPLSRCQRRIASSIHMVMSP